MSAQYKYRFTIFTPCYNSEKFIHRVFESLESQEFRDFEWIVLNDASTDNTHTILENYKATANFPVQYINLSQNQMLSNNFNMAFEMAQGELMVFAGHDDLFFPETLKVFDETWEKYGNENISGIKCLCENQYGKLIGKEFPQPVLVTNFFTIFCDYLYTYEGYGCTRTDVLRRFKFDTSEILYVPEGTMWCKIGMEYDTIFLNRVLRTYYQEADNKAALTKSGRLKYTQGTFYLYTLWINHFMDRISGHIMFKLRFYFAFVFYGILSGNSFFKIIRTVKPFGRKIIAVLFYPIAFFTYLKMKISGKGL
jgi:glycosyltransferase involved in cell wall biosynthesis